MRDRPPLCNGLPPESTMEMRGGKVHHEAEGRVRFAYRIRMLNPLVTVLCPDPDAEAWSAANGGIARRA